MKRKFDFNSIKVRLWLQYMLFAVIILGVLWSLQILFIRAYYQQMKTNEVKAAAAELVQKYGSESFEKDMQQIAFKNNLNAMLLDMEGNVLVFGDIMGNREPRKPPPEMLEPLKEALKKSTDGNAIFTFYNATFHNPSIVVGALLTDAQGEKQILMLNSNLDPIESTVKILSSQLIYVTIILLVLAFVLSFFISRRIAKPITKLTDTTERLAQGDYNVHFESGAFSEVNKLSSTLNYAAKQISKVDELRKDLIANVSHDLRTPLTMIKAYAEMLRDLSGENPKKRSEHLNVIIAETDRLSSLVNNILDLSRIQAGTDEVKISVFNISETVNCIMQRYAILSEKEGYRFILDCPDDIFAKGDAPKIEQVIYNLVNNAINYTGEDKHVFVTLSETPGKVRFEVRDTGEGINEEDMESIWERYYKVDKTHKRAVVGTGLGLSIVKSILEYHGASYGVHSEPGKGASFWFELEKSEDENEAK